MNTIEVLKRLKHETTAEVFIVGGFVRDFLRNKKNNDIDVVVRGLPLEGIKKFLSKYGKVTEVNLAKTNDTFTTNIILFKASRGDFEAQIALPRRGKRQVQDFRTRLRHDVKCRDFTINALYLPIDFKSKRDVIDLVEGRKDIANRKIRANGNADDRIKESPIRMMRAISLAARTNYTIDKELLQTIRRNAELIKKCPAEPVRIELNKIIMSKKPSKYFNILRKVGLLKYIMPELERCAGVKQDTRYHKYDVFTHLIYTVDNCERDLKLRLAGLLHDIGKTDTYKEVKGGSGRKITFHKHEMVSIKLARNLLKRLKYDTETIKDILNLIKFHMYHYTREWTDSAMRKFIKKSGITEEFLHEDTIETFPLFKLRAAERLGNGLKTTAITDRQKDFERRLLEVYRESTGLDVKDLKVNGDTLMSVFKLKPGETIGNILDFLLENVLENPALNEELSLLKLATEYLYNDRQSAENE